jgi:hypothetical protein
VTGANGFIHNVGGASSSGGKNKADRIKGATQKYLVKARLIDRKLSSNLTSCASEDNTGIARITQLHYYRQMLNKHIDLEERRLVSQETYLQGGRAS